MRIRDLLTSGISIAVVVVHFALQWYGWKLHIGQPTDAGTLPPDDSLWQMLSFPLFTLVPRRLQNIYFMEMLVGNSAVWGLVTAWCSHMLLRRMRFAPRRRLSRADRAAAISGKSPAPQTRTDRLVELKRLRDQDLVSKEEYVRQRNAILSGL